MKQENIESVYELSPVQQGMLFYSLYAPSSGVYVVQLSVRLQGELDVPTFERAWQQVVDRHGAVRTSFHWEELERPVQVVYRHLEVDVERRSWRGLSPPEQRRRLQEYLRTDRIRGFELGTAPLMRLALFELGERAFQFVWSFHHLCLDGWSTGLVLQEVFTCYRALSRGEPVRLVRAPAFERYILWLQQQPLAEAKRYWQKVLAGLTAATPLGPRQEQRTVEHRHQREEQLPLSAAATAALQAVAGRHRLTLNTLVQGAWALLLSRYSGERDVVFGATVAGRPAELPGVEAMVGMFINTLPVRVAVAHDEPLVPWLQRLLAQQAELRRYEHSPLDQVQKWSEVAAGRALFEHILVFESFPLDVSLRDSVPGLEISDLQPMEQTNYPLTVLVVPGPRLVLKMIHDRRRFGPSMIRRLLRHWRHLLAGLAADPQRRLGEFPLLTAAERQQILNEWNATAEPYLLDRCLHELIAAQAARTPAAEAVVYEDQTLSYRELELRAAALAHRLRRLGVGPEVVVGVLMERSLELVVTLVAILKAGGAYLPLEPSYPRERLAFMVADAGVPVVVTREHLRDRVPAGPAHVLLIPPRSPLMTRGDAPAHPKALSVDAPGAAAEPLAAARSHPDQLAYVIYTSGSTGRPKGSMISHRGIVNRILWMQQAYGLEPGEGVLQKTPFTFDVSVWEFFWPLCFGARLVVARPGGHQDGAYLAALIRRRQVTTVHFVPSMLQPFLDEPAVDECRCLRRVIASGEALSYELQERFHARTEAPLHNLYGPTEASVDVTFWPCERDAPRHGVPIGRPIANLRIHLLDRGGQPVPVGVAGELYIAGVGLARGYLGRPGLTAERFVPDPFPGPEGGRLYRSGDQARFRPDGAIEYLGRLDHQVKVRGMRIELGEIETVLAAHPAVRQVAVLARPQEAGGGQRLVAWVAAEPPPTIGQLRDFVQEKLPEYMVPSAFAFLDSLPLLPNGKVDRRALAQRPLSAPDDRREHLGTAFVAPRSSSEKVLAQIWAEVLGCRRVGVEDSFFELGGDSILSIRVVARAREEGLLLTPRDLFRYPRLGLLAAAAAAAPAVEAEQQMVTGPVPLTPIQHWFFERRLAAPDHFNQALMLELREGLDEPRLRRALAALLAHHDALRLRFFPRGSEWRQINAGLGEAEPLVRVDLAALARPGQRTALEGVAAAVQGSLDLSRGPVLRMALIERGPGRTGRLLWVIHHLAVDGVSWRLLVEDLERACRQLERGEAVSLPAKTTSFRSWSEKLREMASSAALKAQSDHWRAAGGRAWRLPRDHPGGVNTLASTRTVRVELDPNQTRALLTEVPAAYANRINDVLLAALALALGGKTLRVDLEGHGREEPDAGIDLSRTVGWFTSLYPVVLELGPLRDPGAVLKAVKEQLRAVPGGGVGYGVLRYLSPDPETVADLRALPAAPVLFNYLGQLDEMFASSQLFRQAPEDGGPAVAAGGLRSHPLEINALVSEGRLQVVWSYSENLHRRPTVEGWARGFRTALEALIRHCRSPEAGGYTPSDFPLAGLDQARLDALPGATRGIVDLYPLAPLQRGILFHTLYEPESGEYFEQLSCELVGELSVPAFRRAWQWVVDRHPVLRTCFLWEGLEEPLQMVRRTAALPWTEEDWRGRPEAAIAAALGELRGADRRRGFELTAAPLARATLIRTSDSGGYFLFSFHHLLLDGWSLARLFEELFHCYQSLRRGQAPEAAAPPPYRDYVAWLAQRDLAAAEAYWRRTLEGFTTPTTLTAEPTPERAGAPLDYRQRQVTLPAALRDRLQGLAGRQRLTFNTLIQGAWALLVARHTAAEDVLYGTTVSGRPAELPKVESMVGLFINTLPVRVQVPPDQLLAAWLGRLRDQQAELRQYEHSPLEQVQKWSEVPAERALFDHFLVVENYPRDAALGQRLEGLEVRAVQSFERTNYALTVAVVPAPTLGVRMLYDARTCEPVTVERLLGHFANLLRAFAADPRRRLGEVPMLAAGERHQLLWDWNATARPFPRDALVHELFAAQAERAPAAPAVVAGREQLSYGELEARSSGLARELRRLGVGPESRVAVVMPGSPELVVALLAVLRAGGAYVALDPAYPPQRLSFMAADAGAAVALTREELVARLAELAEGGIRVLTPRMTARGDGAPAPPAVGPGNLAYVIYTSGSTGVPKGVAVTHRSLMNLVSWHRQLYRLGPGERTTQIASPGFDASVWEIWPALAAGATLCIPDPETRSSPAELVAWLAAEAVTVSFLPTPLAELALAREWPSHAPLRTLLTGGEKLRHRPRPGLGFALMNHYGPTENTVVATCGRVAPGPGGEEPSIGRPIANVGVYLLDRRLRPVPLGAAGELCLGGPSLARGYLGRPARSAELFVPDPFAGPGERLYRTGDLTRFRPDGRIEFLGRIDHQVKIRGFRIELGEIEAVLCEHPGVREAAVVARGGPEGGDEPNRLVAYVAPAADGMASGELRAFLARKLPDYMVPAAFVELAELPRTAHHKLDRAALAAPEWQRDEQTAEAAPRTPVEELVAGIWSDVLGLEAVGIHDDFFELGGHSLLATQVVSRVREALRCEMPLRRLFEAPTVAGLAALLDRDRSAVPPPAPSPLGPLSRAEPLPLSFAQQRLWFLAELEPESVAYNVPAALRLSGRLAVPVLAASLNAIVRRHEALRTTFTRGPGEEAETLGIQGPVQVISPSFSLVIPVVDLRPLAAAGREAEARRLAALEARRRFDLTRGPLLRATLVRLADGDHLLLLTVHHIVSDAWSVGVFVRELAALFRAFAAGPGPSPLPPLAIQYADFAVWQRRYLTGEVPEGQLAWWRQQLAGAPAVLGVPTDRPRPPVRTYRGATEPLALPAALAAELGAFARRRGVTLFMTLLSGWKALLRRYTGEEDLLIGTPIANRNRVEIEGLIGFFTNTLVLRTHLAGDPPCGELLARVREVCLEAYAHQDLPFELLVDHLQPERNLSHSPLFQVLFVLQNAPAPPLELPGLTLRQVATDSGTSKFDLTFAVAPSGDGLATAVEYNADLFDRTTAGRMARHFQTLLRGLIADPEARLSALPLISFAERGQLVAEWNDSRRRRPLEVPVHHLFERQAARTPERVAVVCGRSTLTYGELERRANQLAHHLGRLGVGPDVAVGLCLERSAEMPLALLGVLKAGGTCVPLDPAYPEQRLAFMVAETAAPVILTHRRLAAGLGALAASPRARLLCVDADWPQVAAGPAHRPAVPVALDNLFYVIYTSGSTGRPKGVSLAHRAILNLLAWHLEHLVLGARTLQYASLSFDASYHETFAAWASGGTVLVVPEELRRDVPALAGYLAARQVEKMILPVVVLHRLAEDYLASGPPPSLREITATGEQLRVTPQVAELFALLSGCPLHNHYGPSESHVVTAYTLCGEPSRWPFQPPIGRPIANSQAHVLDRRMQPVALGVTGELYLGGDCLARGYLDRPRLTAERFLPDPLGGPGARLYRTGDLARWLPGGDLEFLGRTDDQVKVRGFRVEPAEIEAVLDEHPGVDQAVVLARDDLPGGRGLVAWVVPATDPAPPVDELRCFLAAKLPDYMVPAAIGELAELPLTPNRKLDREALGRRRLPSAEAPGWVAPRTPQEELLAGIWAAVLGREQVGAEDDFFALGGHSLLATQVVSRVRQVFGVEIPLRRLFEAPTVTALAAVLTRASREGRAAAPPLRPVPRTGDLPLSFAQERLWFIAQLEPESAAYHLPAALRLSGRLDPAVLAGSLNAIVRRHEVLRTRFVDRGGRPVQVVAPRLELAIPAIDLGSLPAAAAADEVRRLAGDEARRPFDLGRGPLLRAQRVRLGAPDREEHVLLFVMHHVVADGWSMGVLVREVAALYRAGAAGRPSPLAALAIQYADFAVWQRQWLAGEVLAAELGYWRRQLAGAPPQLELPTDRPRPAVPNPRGGALETALEPELTGALQALGRRYGVTLFMTLLAGFKALLGRYTGHRDVVVGSPIAGRNRREIEELIGFFVNTLVLRTDLSGDPSFLRLLARVREVTLDAYAHQDLPFERLVDALTPERDLSSTPLFQVMFVLQNVPRETLEIPGLTLAPLATETATAAFDLTLSLQEDGGRIIGAAEYACELFDGVTIRRLLAHFGRLLASAVEDPHRRLSELTWWTPGERQQLVVEWSLADPAPAAGCVHDLLAARAERRPEATAVVCGARHLSYGELNRRANGLAHLLRAEGVGPEVRVGLCLPRSAEVVIGLVAILKAGGAFVPLDPDYPAERLAFMVEDAGISVLVTDRWRRGQLPVAAAGTVCIDAPEAARRSGGDPGVRVDLRNLAYVIYTSGSTGRPKGVGVPHGALAGHCRAIDREFALTVRDRVLQMASFSFDAALEQALPALLRGAVLVVAGGDLWLPGEFSARLAELAVTVTDLPAGYWQQWVEEAPPAGAAEAPSSLRAVSVGGDVMPAVATCRWHRTAMAPAQLFNTYGPTEATISATWYRVPGKAAETDCRHRVPIGRPFAGRTLAILDRRGAPVPIGVVGELCLGGPLLARGYLDRPALTAERFVPDPCRGEPGRRLYRTGDLASLRPDGTVDFLGRFDDQVKIRGFRIELGEIAAALAHFSGTVPLGGPRGDDTSPHGSADVGIREHLVVARDVGRGPRQLVAYLACDPVPAVRDLRAFLGKRLPAYMIPAAFVFLDALPRLPSGKVDRRALPAPERTTATAEKGFAAPRDSREELLAGIWEEVLAHAPIGTDDNFFELGGHSLLATQLVSRVRTTFGVDLPLRAVFEAPTVAALGNALRTAQSAPTPPLVRAPRGGELPLSFAQQRLWFLDRLVPENPFYNMAGALELAGTLHPEALRRAFSELVRRHEALRTRFRSLAGEPRQVIVAPAPVPLPVVDLEALPEPRREAAVAARLNAELRRPFDLARDCLLRLVLLRLGPRRHVLSLVIHHIISDGWSMSVMAREVMALYEAFAAGQRSPLPELPIQYADFAIWQRQWFRGEVFDQQLAYWRRRLDGIPEVLALPLDRPRPAIEAFRGRSEPFSLPAELVARLGTLSRACGATSAMALMAGFKLLLGRYSGQDDLAVGMAIANRTRREIEDLIGFFVNTLVLRTDLGGAPSFGELIGRVREITLGAYAHQDLPFEMLVEELQPERDLSRNPLVQVMFGFQNFPRAEWQIRDLRVSGPRGGGMDFGTSKFDLTLYLAEYGGELYGNLEYSSDLFDHATIHRLLRHFEHLLAAAVSAPEVPITGLRLLSASEEHQLLREWNANHPPYPRSASIPELFEAQVAATPEAVAVVFGGRQITYRELNRRANRVAHYLRAHGVGPEVGVGLCTERSVEMVVGILGIVKAGGAYVPLDPDYPRERLAFMLADVEARLVLVREELADLLPAAQDLHLVRLDGDPSPFGCYGARNPSVSTTAESLAYLMYTSGSTGRPKGVGVVHRAVVRLVREADYADFNDQVFLQLAPISFDAATLEIWAPLLHGGRLVVLAPHPPSLHELGAALERYRVTTLWLTAGLFHQMVAENLPGLRGVRQLLAGGDVLSARHVRRVVDELPGCTLINGYGPTENTTFTCCYPMRTPAEVDDPVLIGRPIANTRVHVLDRELRPLPIGVVGELYTAGDGLARGYHARPGRSAEKFVPDPVGGRPGERLYCTGDLVRRRPNGTVEFLGRIDHQVKLRGFRIELGEIEAIVGTHPAVGQSVVQMREDVPGDRRLVAYVELDPDYEGPEEKPAEAEWQHDQVEQWGMIFDDIYRREAADPDPTFNVVGWDSTYTGEPLPRDEMREWLEDTVDRILSLAPRRVLEIGCGTGMLLFRIAPRCESYLATDVSRKVLSDLGSQLKRRAEQLPQVRLLHRPADCFDDVEPGSLDVVILNSVVQYFPTVDYLVEVMAKAVAAVRPGGAIFLGDVRSQPLLEAFHASVELFQAPAEMPLERLRQRLRLKALEENELAVDPALFGALAQHLPQIGGVEIHPKRGRSHNELTGFRYQAIVRVGTSSDGADRIRWRDWRREGMTITRLGRLLAEEEPAVLGLCNVPNARVAAAVETARLLATGGDGGDPAMATAGSLRQRLADSAADPAAVDPHALWALSETTPYEVELGWAAPGTDGRFDVVLRHRDADSARPLASLLPPPPRPAHPGPWKHYANNPMLGRFARQVVPELRAFLGERLPDYMVPAAFVLLDSLPLTPNGKVDRAALPAPDLAMRGSDENFVPPRTGTEAKLARIWAELLAVERVGVEDDFFELGGHSLLATQAVSRVREAFAVEVPLRTVFAAPTVAALALEVEELVRCGEADRLPPIVPVARDGELPLSFAQERLWFIHRFDPQAVTYNEAASLRLRGRLDLAALRRSLGEIVRRHENLRTVFPEVAGQAVQRILPAAAFPLPLVDLCRLGPGEGEAVARRLGRELLRRPFDLATGPLVRGLLIALDEDDHAALFAFHHIVFDAWSIGVFSRELTALYGAFAAGRPSPLGPLAVQYADFACWQRQWLGEDVLAGQLDYWRRQLAAVATLDLPTDRPRPPLLTTRGGVVDLPIGPRLTAPLRELSERCGTTLFMLLLAVWKLLLHRYTGQVDVAVGSPIANRNRQETEDLLGFFVNMLVLRSDLGGDPPFATLLDRVREVCLSGFAHQDLPFERLVEELQPQRDLQRTALFQVAFQVLLPAAGLQLPGLDLSPFPVAAPAAKFDLSFPIVDGGDQLAGTLEYNADLFDATTARRLLGHYRNLLAAVVSRPSARLSELPLLSPAERAALVWEWNDGARPFPWPAPIHELIAEQAARTPAAVAVVFADQWVSYGELNARATRLAHHLRSLGVGPETVVGLAAERRPEVVVGLLGILKAGGVYLPLDPSHPAERLAFLLRDADARVVLARESIAGGLPPSERHGARVVCLDGPQVGVLAHQPTAIPEPDLDPDHLAYVIYTSGTTGVPKGVAVSHRQVLPVHLWFLRYFGLDKRTQVLQNLSPCFDFGVFELLMTLLAGGSLYFLPAAEQGMPSRYLDAIARHDLNTVHTTPSFFRELMAQGPTLPGVEIVHLGGEAIRRDLVREIEAVVGHRCRVYNGYGPTETSINSTVFRLQGRPLDRGLRSTAVPIGRATAMTRVYVLDRHGRPVPPGVAGELCIGGDGVARGYLKRPALTAERFVPDPFARQSQHRTAGRRLYRSGDLVRWLPEGVVEFLGRIDHQVKLRGLRLEPEEIEAVLSSHPALRQAVVVPREDSPGDQRPLPARLAAYLVPEPAVAGRLARERQGELAGQSERRLEEELRELARRRLPEYMVPSHWVFLDALPLTPSGKLDRRALPAPETVRRLDEDQYVAPRDDLERELAELLAELLGSGPVGIRSDFFDLGGHSLLAVRLVAEIGRRFGRELALASLFPGATVERLAALIREGGEAAEWSPLVEIQSGAAGLPLFCVHPVGGNVLCYRDLAAALGREQPVYGLQARGLMPGQTPARRVEEMAGEYLRAVRSVQPAGPYALLGWSLGGLVAYEMARQLAADGEDVALVAIVDVWARTPWEIRFADEAEMMLAGLESVVAIAPDELEGRDPDARLAEVIRRARAAGALAPEFTVADARRYLQVVEAGGEALETYSPGPYPGRVTLFRATEAPPQAPADDGMGWRGVVGGQLDVVPVPGSHQTMIYSPRVRVLAERLRDRLGSSGKPVA